MILPKGRDPRFITIRRGGTLTVSDHRLLALWAAACAEHVLCLFQSVQPSDLRPRQAIGKIRAWARGEIRMSQSRARHAPASVDHGGHRVYFCSEHCQERFDKNPERYLTAAPRHRDGPTGAIDPICGMSVDPRQAAAHRQVGGEEIFFCGLGCAEEFDRRKSLADTSATSSPVAFPPGDPV